MGNHNGVVDYEEFADEIFKVKSENSHTMMVFMKYQVASIQESMQTAMVKLADHSDMLKTLTGERSIIPNQMPKVLLNSGSDTCCESNQSWSSSDETRASESADEPGVPSPIAVKSIMEVQEANVQALRAMRPLEAKLGMPIKASGANGVKPDMSGDIFERCGAVEDKIDTTITLINNLTEIVEQHTIAEVAPRIVTPFAADTWRVKSDLLAVPEQSSPTAKFRRIPPCCCGGTSGLTPPSSILSIDVNSDAESLKA